MASLEVSTLALAAATRRSMRSRQCLRPAGLRTGAVVESQRCAAGLPRDIELALEAHPGTTGHRPEALPANAQSVKAVVTRAQVRQTRDYALELYRGRSSWGRERRGGYAG